VGYTYGLFPIRGDEVNGTHVYNYVSTIGDNVDDPNRPRLIYIHENTILDSVYGNGPITGTPDPDHTPGTYPGELPDSDVVVVSWQWIWSGAIVAPCRFSEGGADPGWCLSYGVFPKFTYSDGSTIGFYGATGQFGFNPNSAPCSTRMSLCQIILNAVWQSPFSELPPDCWFTVQDFLDTVRGTVYTFNPNTFQGLEVGATCWTEDARVTLQFLNPVDP
jgi:hypothetical protein